MIKNSYVYLLILLLVPASVKSGEAIVTGTSAEWANADLTFYRYADLITEKEELLGKTKINQDGFFTLDILVDKTTFVFAHLGIYQVYLYAEPGKKYEIILPPKAEKTTTDLLNPYFDETFLQLGVVNLPENDLNIEIRMFNDMYNPYYNKHVIETFQAKDYSNLDKDIEKMELPFKNSPNSFFKNFREYRYVNLRHLAYQHKAKSISEQFFTDKPVLYDNQAYMDVFHGVFDNYFEYHGRTEAGKKIYDDINVSNNLEELKKTLSKNQVLKGDSLVELVILKCLYDEFYGDKFSRSGIVKVLESLIENTNIGEYKKIATNIRNKVTGLLSGYPPPDFELYDKDSNRVTLNSMNGKYVYLNFCTCSSYSCLSEFEMLGGIYQRHKEVLEVVTIITDPFDEKLNAFLKKNNYTWRFLNYSNQPEVIKDYDIRAFPTYFLLDKEGRLIQSPAPGPNENFEQKLFDYLRSKGEL